MAQTPEQPFDPEAEYEFTLMRKVRIDGMLLPVMDTHTAKGDLLNRIVEQEDADVIATADAR